MRPRLEPVSVSVAVDCGLPIYADRPGRSRPLKVAEIEPLERASDGVTVYAVRFRDGYTRTLGAESIVFTSKEAPRDQED